MFDTKRDSKLNATKVLRRSGFATMLAITLFTEVRGQQIASGSLLMPEYRSNPPVGSLPPTASLGAPQSFDASAYRATTSGRTASPWDYREQPIGSASQPRAPSSSHGLIRQPGSNEPAAPLQLGTPTAYLRPPTNTMANPPTDMMPRSDLTPLSAQRFETRTPMTGTPSLATFAPASVSPLPLPHSNNDSPTNSLPRTSAWQSIPSSGMVLVSQDTAVDPSLEPLESVSNIELPSTSEGESDLQPLPFPSLRSDEQFPLENTENEPREESFTLGPVGSTEPIAEVDSGRSPSYDDSVVVKPLPPVWDTKITEQPTPSQLSLADESAIQRKEEQKQIATLVSAHLLSQRDDVKIPNATAIEPPTGWQAIEAELKHRLKRCDDLLRRGAVLSGKQEAILALQALARSLDQRRGNWQSEPALHQALEALREETDFYQSMGDAKSAKSTQEIASTHKTPILNRVDLTNMAPDTAAQYYRAYAYDQFMQAADGHPWFADLYYALGRAVEKEGLTGNSHQASLYGQAAVCYQASISLSPRQADAATQLGYVFLRLDRTAEAESWLIASSRIKQQPAVWQNLVEVYRRRGDSNAMQWAMQQLAASDPNRLPSGAPAVPRVEQVDPGTFAGISPYNPWTSPGVPGQNSGSQVKTANAWSPTSR